MVDSVWKSELIVQHQTKQRKKNLKKLQAEKITLAQNVILEESFFSWGSGEGKERGEGLKKKIFLGD